MALQFILFFMEFKQISLKYQRLKQTQIDLTKKIFKLFLQNLRIVIMKYKNPFNIVLYKIQKSFLDDDQQIFQLDRDQRKILYYPINLQFFFKWNLNRYIKLCIQKFFLPIFEVCDCEVQKSSIREDFLNMKITCFEYLVRLQKLRIENLRLTFVIFLILDQVLQVFFVLFFVSLVSIYKQLAYLSIYILGYTSFEIQLPRN
eukprot:TRINITY_DN1673_c0_g3_i1.p3 TRINITY_DN1673_c0_g3~~TRINITY_DN1673_c0_g3_i1.p3  ORF type:complete len:202 (-),score=-7.53 TRINITY_DN1673_c0_g3_i1:30-635(-)